MKVLWFSNVALTEWEPKASGTWLHTLSSELSKSGNVQLNIIASADVKSINAERLATY
jgi:hypothetical protein